MKARDSSLRFVLPGVLTSHNTSTSLLRILTSARHQHTTEVVRNLTEPHHSPPAKTAWSLLTFLRYFPSGKTPVHVGPCCTLNQSKVLTRPWRCNRTFTPPADGRCRQCIGRWQCPAGNRSQSERFGGKKQEFGDIFGSLRSHVTLPGQRPSRLRQVRWQNRRQWRTAQGSRQLHPAWASASASTHLKGQPSIAKKMLRLGMGCLRGNQRHGA